MASDGRAKIEIKDGRSITDGTERFNVDEVPKSGLADSGLRHRFETGAMREMAPGKGRFDLISPFVLQRLAVIMEQGTIKYFERNWEHGLPLTQLLDSCMRHLQQYLMGDTEEDHLGQALWNLHCLIHTEMMIEMDLLPKSLDTMPRYLKQPKLVEGK